MWYRMTEGRGRVQIWYSRDTSFKQRPESQEGEKLVLGRCESKDARGHIKGRDKMSSLFPENSKGTVWWSLRDLSRGVTHFCCLFLKRIIWLLWNEYITGVSLEARIPLEEQYVIVQSKWWFQLGQSQLWCLGEGGPYTRNLKYGFWYLPMICMHA